MVSALSPKSYYYKENKVLKHGLPEQKQYGFIAQELEQILPSIVKDKAIMNEAGLSYKGISYDQLLPLLAQAIKELQLDNEALKKENEENLITISAILDRLKTLEANE